MANKVTDKKPNSRVRPKENFNFFYDQRVHSVFYQLITVGIVAWFLWYLFTNTSQNLDARGMKSGFDFLSVQAGFDTDFKLIEYVAGVGSYGDIFILGILNTLFISVLAIIFSTLFGLMVGILRLSDNWLISKVSLSFVEIFRNTPLLIQIIFWYIGVFSLLPQVRHSLDLSLGAEVLILNNRGLYMPWPIAGEQFWISGIAFLVALIIVFLLRRWAHKRRDKTGFEFSLFLPSALIIIILPGAAYLLTGQPLAWDIPTLQGFNFQGGAALTPSFLALLVALTIYHTAHFAETVRAGILSVSKGQQDAGLAIGLRPARVTSLIIIPQAMPAIVPPMISQWMNAVKNSSLAIAIGYPDLVAVFMQTSLNQVGHAIEIVGMTMAFYMFVSLTISGILNIYNKRVQRVEC